MHFKVESYFHIIIINRPALETDRQFGRIMQVLNIIKGRESLSCNNFFDHIVFTRERIDLMSTLNVIVTLLNANLILVKLQGEH